MLMSYVISAWTDMTEMTFGQSSLISLATTAATDIQETTVAELATS